MKLSHESIMVCVHYGPHGQRLIQRGYELASQLHAPLYVLTVGASEDREYHEEKRQYLSGWKRQTEESGGEFIIREFNGRKIADIIADAAKEKEITQIIIGQSGQSFWEDLTRGNLINDLVERIGSIDLHIVAVQRHPEMLEQSHEQGVTAYLIKEKDRYVLSEEPEEKAEMIKGVFFRELDTDFNNGLFKMKQDGEVRYLRIVDNEWIQS